MVFDEISCCSQTFGRALSNVTTSTTKTPAGTMRIDAHGLTSDATLSVFEREGWLVAPQLLCDATLQGLLNATQELERVAASFERDTFTRGVFFEVQSVTGRKGEPAIFPGALRKITSPSKGHPAFAKLRQDPRVLAAAASCGLAAPRCIIDQVNFKLPHVGTCFPYHQDESFLFGDALARVQQFGGVNLVIALDPASANNGGFEVLGRTHHGGLVALRYDGSQMNHGVFDESHRALPSLSPGDGVLFHPRLAHGSEANRSDRPRRLVTLWLSG
jgi:Phytanoyl-CoA dioxygenase (PhyH)